MKTFLVCSIALVCCAAWAAYNGLRDDASRIPTAARQISQGQLPMGTEKATFAAGCFWGVEETFRQTPGVVATAVGYTGGSTANPTYEQVCTDRTGHAEAVEIEYDPTQVSYDDLLALFFKLHDPTTKNRQGPDIGSQYRSAVFYHNDQQRASAEAAKKQLEESGKFRRPIVTQIVKAAEFYRAEEYHQQYVAKHGGGSCHL